MLAKQKQKVQFSILIDACSTNAINKKPGNFLDSDPDDLMILVGMIGGSFTEEKAFWLRVESWKIVLRVKIELKSLEIRS